MHGFSGFVALGDSFTEGLDDALPDGTYRGWADLVAHRLASYSPGFRYANLAIRGRLLGGVIEEQLPAALAMRADLVSFSAGVNDAMRRRFDINRVGDLLDATASQIAATGATLILFTSASDLARRLPAGRLLARRMDALNAVVRRIAAAHGAVLVEHQGDSDLADPRMWSVDRIHLSTLGHQRVASRVLAALGVPTEPSWSATLPPHDRPGWWAARRADARWARMYLAPWVRRRLRGRSSGDGLRPKRPQLAPIIVQPDPVPRDGANPPVSPAPEEA